MGIISGILGNASEVDAEKLESDLQSILAENENIDKAFKLIESQ